MNRTRVIVDTVFAFATVMEAQPLLEILGAKPLADEIYPIYRSAETAPGLAALIVITGMGLTHAADVIADTLRNVSPRFVVNAGIAGALKSHYAVGELVRVSAVAEVADDAREAAVFRALSATAVSWLPRTLAVGRLVSRPSPLFDPELVAALGTTADLVDMEGAAIACACARSHVPCALLKAVSDHADDRAAVRRNLDFASRRLAQFLADHYRRPAFQETDHERSCASFC